MFKSLAEINNANNKFITGRKAVCTEDRPISVSVQSSGKKNQKPQLILTIHDFLMKRLRWVGGDRVEVLIDIDNRKGLLRRTHDKGYILYASERGSMTRSKVKATLPPNMLYDGKAMFSRPATEISITDEGVMFTFPEQRDEQK